MGFKIKALALSFFFFGFMQLVWAGFDEAVDAYDREDYKTAFRGFSLLAEQGNARAQFNLGVMYSDGIGVTKDEQQAVVWYRKSAEQGNTGAQFNLGNMYANGRGVAKDERQAAAWFRKAAVQGDAVAQLRLGIIYVFGQGLPKDEPQAVVWYRRSAEQGNAGAQLSLGIMYDSGRGAPKDEQQAYFWWLLASANGNEDAKKYMGIAEETLLPQQRAQAQADARVWRPKTAQQVAETSLLEGAAESPKDTDERDSPAPQTKGGKSSGTGFVVGQNQVVTNVHVVDGCAVLKVNGKRATVSAIDTSNDLVLLNTSLNIGVATLRAGNLRQGDEINAVGYPLYGLLASGAQITSGNVSALAGLQNDSRFIQISAPVQPGNSGGPLVDASGNVVGVIVSKLNAVAIATINGDIPQNINFAISPLVLKGFLEANRVKYKTAASNKNLSTANVMSIASRYTVLVECSK